jgi:hypothetical protein
LEAVVQVSLAGVEALGNTPATSPSQGNDGGTAVQERVQVVVEVVLAAQEEMRQAQRLVLAVLAKHL